MPHCARDVSMSYKRRRWFNVYLSTVLVVSVVAVLLIAAIVRLRVFGEWPFDARPMQADIWTLNAVVQSVFGFVAIILLWIACDDFNIRRKGRPWIQFHLSTGFVLMIVAAGVLGANIVPRLNKGQETFGMPVPFGERYQDASSFQWKEDATFRLGGDALAALLLLGTIAIGCEWRICRREARKP